MSESPVPAGTEAAEAVEALWRLIPRTFNALQTVPVPLGVLATALAAVVSSSPATPVESGAVGEGSEPTGQTSPESL